MSRGKKGKAKQAAKALKQNHNNHPKIKLRGKKKNRPLRFRL